MPTDALKVEMGFFEKHRAEFLKDHAQEFVLVKGTKAHGFFRTDKAAYKAGVEKFGVKPFLIKEVVPAAEEKTFEIPAYSLGLMHAVL